ncbi:SpoIIE family protein phosphatase [Desulfothermobacter acidiphilus]|uniref:SpoIIE family protein phosphatase n=1 Tax=Desulfothermobacter acidiphilus TaxID=1938353 RepID=UPI003F8C9C8D
MPARERLKLVTPVEALPARKARSNALGLLWPHLPVCLIGVFLGRALLLGELAPFGVAYGAAVTLSMGRSFWPVWLAVLLGQWWVLPLSTRLAGAVALLGTALILGLVPARSLRSPWNASLLVGSSYLVLRSLILLVGQATAHTYISLLLEGVFAGALTFVFLRGLSAWQAKGFNLAIEELFCLFALGAGVIAGTGEMAWGMVTVKGVLTRLALLLAAQAGGAGVGAAAGALLGIIPGLSLSNLANTVPNYAFTGLLAGSFRSFGRVGQVLGFGLGNLLLVLPCTAEAGLLTAIVLETALAVALYFLLPSHWYAGLQLAYASALPSSPQSERLDDWITERLENWNRVYRELAATFSAAERESSPSWPGAEEAEKEVLEELRRRICSSCPLSRICWEREKEKTLAWYREALAFVRRKGAVRPENLPSPLARRCLRWDDLTLTLAFLWELHRTNRFWCRKVRESRAMVVEQFQGFARMLQDLVGEVGDKWQRVALVERELLQLAAKNGRQIKHLQVRLRPKGMVEVEITARACRGERFCQRELADLLSRLSRWPYTVAHANCPWPREAEECRFLLYPALRYRLALGMARSSEGCVSGDTYSYVPLPGGRCALVLSDGMGRGAGAAVESATAVSLLELLLKAGFGEELAVKLTNSLVLLRTPGDAFTTLDMAVIDLYTGRLRWVKIGASPGFVLRRDGVVEIIRASSLPAGVLSPIDIVVLERDLRPGDVVVLGSDGWLEAYRGERKEEWWAEQLQESGPREAEELSRWLLERGRIAAGGRLQDDATVVVAKLLTV